MFANTLCKFYDGITPELLEDSGTSMRFSFGLLSWNPGQWDWYPGQAQIPFSLLHQQQTVSPIKKQLTYYNYIRQSKAQDFSINSVELRTPRSSVGSSLAEAR